MSLWESFEESSPYFSVQEFADLTSASASQMVTSDVAQYQLSLGAVNTRTKSFEQAYGDFHKHHTEAFKLITFVLIVLRFREDLWIFNKQNLPIFFRWSDLERFS